MTTKKHPASSNAVYNTLREQILHLELIPGTAISEIDTAAKYQVSRTPVRDAFKALEAEGLLEIRPHVGTFVSLIDLNMISDILYMREHLELAILKDLCRTFDKSQEYRIRLILHKQKDLIASDMSIIELSRAFILADNEFHYTLFDMAGKKNVSTIFHSMSSEYERFRTFINWDGKDTLLRLHHDHEEIFRCIVEKDITTLEKLVSHHIYDGFISGSEIYYKKPEYFKTKA